MKPINKVLVKIKELLKLSITVKGDVEISVYEKDAPECAKTTVEIIEDGKTVEVKKLAAFCGAVLTAFALIKLLLNIFDD